MLGEMNLVHDFFQVSKLSKDQTMEHFFSPNSGEDQKKRSSPKMERFFSLNSGEDKKKGLLQKWNAFFPNSGEDQKKRSSPKNGTLFFPDAHQSQIIGGGMPMKTILKLLGGYSQIIGEDISPPSPSGFQHPCFSR